MRRLDTVSVIGLGYIGLPTALVLAQSGFQVCGVDIDPAVLANLALGKADTTEPGLKPLLQDCLASGRLCLSDEPAGADAYILAVPTPLDKTTHTADLTALFAATRAVAPHLRAGGCIAVESTIPPGVTKQVTALLATLRPDLRFPPQDSPDIAIAYCPERVLPGRIIEELRQNDRIIGGLTPECAAQVARIYTAFCRGNCHQSDARTAEITKLAENAYRDVNIAFANELSLICDAHGANAHEVIALANHHPRVGILSPGAGVGGHCIAVDPWFLIGSAPENATLLRSARAVNDAKPEFILRQIRERLRTGAEHVALYGLSYKPESSDLRESPAVRIALELLHTHAGPISVVEPHIDRLPEALDRTTLINHPPKGADIHVLLTPHPAFRTLDMQGKTFIDPTGMWG